MTDHAVTLEDSVISSCTSVECDTDWRAVATRAIVFDPEVIATGLDGRINHTRLSSTDSQKCERTGSGRRRARNPNEHHIQHAWCPVRCTAGDAANKVSISQILFHGAELHYL